MKEKYIEALNALKSPTIVTSYDLQTWQAKAINTVIRIYGENSKQEEQVKEIQFRSYPSFGVSGGRNRPSTRSGGGNNAAHCAKQAHEIIASFIADLETFGVPELKRSESNSGINISLSQNQNQTVNVNVIWESLKDELTGKQLKEVEEIVNDSDDPESKKSRIFNKLKSFGGDLASNIIAGLLTNPAMYGAG